MTCVASHPASVPPCDVSSEGLQPSPAALIARGTAGADWREGWLWASRHVHGVPWVPRLGLLALCLCAFSACDTTQSDPPGSSAGRSEAVLAPGVSPTRSASEKPSAVEVKAAAEVKAGAVPAGEPSAGLRCRPVADAKIPSVAVPVVHAGATEQALRFIADDRPVLINLWAAWCEPCKAEIPLLRRFQQELARDGRAVDVVFVSLDDDSRQLDRFLQQPGGLDETFFLPEGKVRQDFLQALGQPEAPRLPLQVLAAASGEVRCVIDGAIDEVDLPALRQRLLSL